MALGDGIRRNVATISQEERDLLLDAFLKLDMPPNVYPDGVTYWDKQEDIHKNAHEAGQNVHFGPAFLPWHRELCNRLEALLRGVHPELSLHYWDWTTDPRATPDGTGGTINLFTSQFMGDDGSAGINRIAADGGGDAGPPFQNFESSENAELGNGHTHIWRNVNNGNPGTPPIPPDQQIVTTGDNAQNQDQYHQMSLVLQHMAHDVAHEYIGGTLRDAHYSFHDPFVFLLHSNADRLLAMWQTSPGRAWRLDPNQVYGTDGSAPSITADLQPWAGDVGTGVPPLPPWVPGSPDVQVKNSKHPTVVAPPRYDTNPPPRGGVLHIAQTTPNGDFGDWSQLGDAAGVGQIAIGSNADGRLEVFAVDTAAGLVWHTAQGTPNGAFGGWSRLFDAAGAGQIAVGRNADGRLEVFAVDTAAGLVWHTAQSAPNGDFGGWSRIFDAAGAGQIAVGSNADGRLEVFALDRTEGSAWHVWQTTPNGDFGSWQIMGDARGVGHIAVGSNADGRLEVFAVDTAAGLVWHTAQGTPNGAFGGWSRLFDAAGAGQIAVGSNADGRLEVFALDRTEGSAWHVWQTTPNGDFGSWQIMGDARGVGQIAVGRNADGRLEVFAVDTAAGLAWHTAQSAPNGDFGGWSRIFGAAGLRQIAVGSNADGRLEVFAVLR